jgi:streptomycin 6-kinase
MEDGAVTLVVPANLAANMQADGPPGGREWLASLPGTVQDLAERWSIRLGPPFQPGGTSAWVAPARDDAGRDLVLKVGWAHPEAVDEAAGLRAWDGHGAVLVHRAHFGDSTNALLLERCRPGESLGALMPEPEQDEIVAGLLRRLWAGAPGDHPFRPLSVMCAAWADGFERREATAPTPTGGPTGPNGLDGPRGPGEPGGLDPGVTRLGLELLRGLPATAERQVLLATDLHAANILSAQREPWLMIDPKPYLGDPAYDVIQHLLNCEERLTADPVALALRMANLLDLDAERVTQWLFARCVQESIEQPWLRPVAQTLAGRHQLRW